MRACLLLLPILLFAQSSSPPSKSVPIDNAVPAAKGTRDSAPKKAEAKPQAPSTVAAPAQASSDESQQAAKASPANKPSDIAPDPIIKYTKWLVIVGGLQFVALIIQAVFLYLAFRETTAATNLTRRTIGEAERANAANEVLTRESNSAAQAATQLTRQSIVLTHRPKLIVKNLVIDEPSEADRFISESAGERPFKPGVTILTAQSVQCRPVSLVQLLQLPGCLVLQQMSLLHLMQHLQPAPFPLSHLQKLLCLGHSSLAHPP